MHGRVNGSHGRSRLCHGAIRHLSLDQGSAAMNSRPPSPLDLDHADRLAQFIQDLAVNREAVASELDVLCSIYGENSIRIWPRGGGYVSGNALRYEVDTK